VLYTALLDANVLHPMVLCDLLIRLAQAGLYRACWTEQILEEVVGSIQRRRPDISPDRLKRRTAMMKNALPDACITGYQTLLPSLSSFGTDAHVAAAAIVGRVDAIVTSNSRDFPESRLEEFGVEVLSPDSFLIAQWGLDRESVLAVLRRQAAALTRPKQELRDVLRSLRAIVPAFAGVAAEVAKVTILE
jgi:hypothetical protein